MASSSICTYQVKYDVFLSFRGKDTRNNFTSHFHAALCRRGINVFLDDKLNRGDEILSLMDVIQGSNISVIIFSEDYASSRWCLEELSKILECKNKYGQIVIPIFYHVDPSDVRNQAGIFEEAFTEHKKHFKGKMQRWRNALKETANLSGWHLDGTKSESILMEKIIQDIFKRLKDMFSSDNKHLVGVESMIRKIESSFWVGINDVCTIGIWGIGGIGKTTIASAVVNKISSQFESSYFTQNVREESENPNGLTYLREKLLSTILEDRNLCIGTPNMGNAFIKNRLSNKKVLIVFDDVTFSEQIELLIGDLNCLGFGSRIIITTRDQQVLRNCGVDQIYPVVGLSDNHALQLFSQSAFKQDYPLAGYTKLSDRAVRCAKCVPLALKVLGRFLQNRKKQVWESALDKLEESPHKDIQNVLKISYDGLDDEEKDLFLDIACFFKGWDKCLVEEILASCGFHVQIVINVLIDKALITNSYNSISMHDLLQAMGKEIVKQESIHEPGKRSRLWHHNDIYRVLTYNMGTEKIRGLCIDMFNIREIHLTACAFSNMHNIMFFMVYNSNREKNSKVHGFDGLKSNFRELRYLNWYGYPERSLPSEIHPENIVVLKMGHSNLEQLWPGVKNLANLKSIDLSYSNRLLKIPDLSYATNLKSLILENCTSLFEITPLSIQNINSLVNLNLRNCRCLNILPTGIQSKSLKFVILSGCSNLNTAPKISCNMEVLCLDGTAIKELSCSIEYAPRLVQLNLENCSSLESLPSNICELKSLRHLSLSNCLNLKIVSKMPYSLEELDLDGTAVIELPSSIENLHNLVRLKLTNCSRLKSLPNGFYKPKSLAYLFLSGCSNLKTIPEIPCNIQELYLDETAIKELPLSIEYLFCLFRLSLRNCTSLQSLPNGICMLKSLKYLDISGCSKLDRLPVDFANLQSLEVLEANEIPVRDLSPILRLRNLGRLSMERCTSLELVGLHSPTLPGLQFLCSLNLSDCSIRELPNGLGQLSSLRDLRLAGNYFESIPTSIINLSNLEALDLRYCNMLKFLPKLPCKMKFLEADSCTSLQALSLLPNLAVNGLSFINCLNLDLNASNHLADRFTTLLSARSFTSSTSEKREDMGIRSYIRFPGSEIPKWFNFQSNGFFIELPQGLPDSNFDGFAFCTVLAFQDYRYDRKELNVEYQLYVICEDGRKKVADGSFCAWDEGRGPKYIESDHVYLGYEFRKFNYNSKAIISFKLTHDFWEYIPAEYCKIKKCGVHFFSTQKSMKAVEESRSRGCFISDEEEEKEEPISKRLKFQIYTTGESSSSSGVPSVNEKEVEEFSPDRNESSSFTLLDLNEFPQDYVGSTMEVIATTIGSPADNDGAEPSGSGCCYVEVEPQPKRLKEFKFF